MPRPGALKHTGQAIVGDAVQRVSYSRTGRHVAKIQQGHEVYPQWLRHRVSPPKRESMPVFMRGSTSAYLLPEAIVAPLAPGDGRAPHDGVLEEDDALGGLPNACDIA